MTEEEKTTTEETTEEPTGGLLGEGTEEVEEGSVSLILKDKEYEFPKSAVSLSGTIKSLMAETDGGDTIPLMEGNVEPEALEKIVEFCKQHAQFESNKTVQADVDEWNKSFLEVELVLLFQIMAGANYLEIQKLLDLTCQNVADMISVRTPNEICEFFNIRTDATEEEEDELMEQFPWIDPEGLIKKDREKRKAEQEKP